MKNYYHGSSTSGITQLEARSRLHNTDERIVYLTDSIPYALYYIWDVEHNGCSSKHVTGWIKNDIAYYEEQFPDQLKTFYQGVSGYLYRIADSVDIKAVADRTNMFYCTSDVKVDEATYIPDVYKELLKYEAEGFLLFFGTTSNLRRDKTNWWILWYRQLYAEIFIWETRKSKHL